MTGRAALRDGGKALYCPIIRELEPRFAAGMVNFHFDQTEIQQV